MFHMYYPITGFYEERNAGNSIHQTVRLNAITRWTYKHRDHPWFRTDLTKVTAYNTRNVSNGPSYEVEFEFTQGIG